MKYHSLFLSKIREDIANLLSAAVMIGAIRVKCLITLRPKKICVFQVSLSASVHSMGS